MTGDGIFQEKITNTMGLTMKLLTIDNTPFLHYFNIYKESFLLFFTLPSSGYKCGFVVSFSQRNPIFIFIGDFIIGQVFYYLFRFQLCSIKDNGSPPAVFDDIQSSIQ